MDIAIAGIMIVLIGFVGLALLALWIWALVDVIRMGDQIPYRAGNQLIWILVVALTQVIGALLYLAIGRPDAAHRRQR
ncbi:MAG: PLD nuclease N-terminal domain-containing protein [Nitriliruptoraceae bacterium]